MKKNNLIGLLSAAFLLALTSCSEDIPEREPAAPETNKIQAYIFDNTSDVSIKPGDKDNFIISCGEGTFTAPEKRFPVLIGHKAIDVAAELPLIIEDELGAFSFSSEVISFAAKQAVDTLWVTTLLDFGQSASFSITIPEEYRTAYGNSSVLINVSVDYTWVSCGSVTMESGWEGVTGSVAIQNAKEYTDEAGNSLYRLVSPYYFLAPDFCTEPGLHLNFLLDKDYQAVDLVGGPFIQVENTGYNWIYWDLENYGAYEVFMSSGNQYMISAIWTDGSGLYGPATEYFVWDNGFPGVL